MNTQNLNQTATALPAFQIAQQVNKQLERHQCVVITAPPGAGKSTLLPITVMQAFPEGKILVLEPRRLAARQIAERMAWMLGENVGKTVGYRIRFESKVSEETRIEVLTEGILTRMLIDDPTLDGVSAIIFDEFHERSLTSDVALTLSIEAQQIIRPDLKILIMSATIDTDAICTALQAPLIESQGRMYPVEIRYSDDLPWHDIRESLTIVARNILSAYRQHEGDILVFLPGESEIRRIQELLGTMPDGTNVCPLYGMLSATEQRKAIAPSQPGERKIVLATPIAETSLTIEGVRVVIDSGLCRKMVFDARTGLSHLETVTISMDMARQRSGRAGRMAPGTCYRLWSKAAESRMEDCRIPEILEADLSPMLLEISAWGESNIEHLPWLTPPPRPHLLQATALLQLLNAIDDKGQITPHGRQLVQLPCHPRIAQMLVSARSEEEKKLAADVAAILESSSSSLPLKDAGADIHYYIEALQRSRRGSHAGAWDRIAKASDYYLNVARKIHHTSGAGLTADAGAMIAAAYPERIATAVSDGYGRYRMASGEMATVESDDDLGSHEWIAIAHMNATGGGRVFLGASVSHEALQMHAKERNNLNWDNKQGCVIARRERRIGSLLLESKPLHEIDREDIVQVICEAAHKWGTSMLDFSDAVLELQRRVAAVSVWHPELELPDLSTDAVLAVTEEWLPMYLGKCSTTAEFKKIDLTAALWGLLSYEQQIAVDQYAPTHYVFPSGRRIRIEYRQGAELPILRVRLQECFGMADTPRVDGGKRPLLMELLSPGFKPVQLTQDLKSFWNNTYFEVRKELRRRYPKHAWPENPAEYIQNN